jgi:glycyl-tRNA synthetase
VADRGCFDVQAHMRHSQADLTAFERFDEPKEVEQEAVRPKYDALGPLFKGKAKAVAESIGRLSPESARGKKTVEVNVGGERLSVPSSCFEIGIRKEKVSGRKLVPHVIEPSYGVDRILYSVLEHAYRKKDDYVTLGLKGLVAPVKAGVFPLMSKDGLDTVALEISNALSNAGLASYYDDSGSIGRRYARMDEIGTPCCVTVDYDTKSDGTVTLRERDSAEQVRIQKKLVPKAVEALVHEEQLNSLSRMK